MTRWINGVKPSDVMTGPEKWTQGAFARADGGAEVLLNSNRAVCFCAEGVLRKTAVAPFLEVIELRWIVRNYIGKWNDDPTRTFEEVREALLKLEAME